VIADEGVYADLLERVVRRAEALKIGPAKQAETDVGPLIDAAHFQKVASYVDGGRADGRLVAGGERDDTIGFFHHPTVFADVPPDARLMQEEIFGPVVAFTRARGIDEALAIANGTEYGLTGGVFARDPAVLAQARREFHVGNLYFNRKITGALVGVEPFGGFDMSGTNAKAGGRDYSRLLVQAKVVSERI
jgi:1-pyrroline-5-carboxylate dehydrogenase